MIKALVNRYQAVFAFAIMIIILGISSYTSLPRESAPEIRMPRIFVTTPYIGVAASDIEQLITKPIEEELDGLEGIKKITSTSQLGFSFVDIEFTGDTDVETALRRVRQRVDVAQPKLPTDAEEPEVKELNFSDQPVMILVISNPGNLETLEKLANSLEEDLKRVQGVRDITFSGKPEKELAIELNPAKMQHYGVTLKDVRDAIYNENRTIPGGELRNEAKRFAISVTGEIKKPKNFENILVTTPDGVKIYLKDLANVRFQYKAFENYSRLNGVEAISLNIKKKSGENLLRIAEEIKNILAEKETSFPEGTHWKFSFDQSEDIKSMVADLENNILSGLLLVWLVTLFFLGWRNALFVGLAIPFSMLISFFILSLCGITLNMVVLFALVLALGMLVDNGIVIVENIYRHSSLGKDRIQASIDGTKEVALPIIASTATTILAFFPIVFMPDIMGEFMSYIPITVIIVLSSSLIVGLTLNPVFCSRFLKIEKNSAEDMANGGKGFQKLQNTYVKALKKALANPFKVMSFMVVLVIAGFMVYGAVGKEPIFFPSLDPKIALVNIEMPQGTTLKASDEVIKHVEALIPTTPNSISTYQAVTGRKAEASGQSSDGSHFANIRIGFAPFLERKISGRTTINALQDSLKEFSHSKVTVEELKEGPPTGYPVSYEVTGSDYSVIGQLADSVLAILKTVPELKLADHDYEEGKPEVRVEIDRDKATRLGLSTTLIASAIRDAMNGGIVSKFRQGTEEYDVVIRYQDKDRNTLGDLEALIISKEGKHIPLSSVATLVTQAGPGVIKRKDLKRSVEVWGDFKEEIQNKEEIKASIQARINALHIPNGHNIGSGEGAKTQDEATAFLGKAFLIALLLIFILLIIQFNSVTQPFIIMVSVFLSVGGVFWGLALTGKTFVVIMSGIGIISLAGVVVNNAIVLIDYTNLLVKQGYSHYDAIVHAGQTRLRPVLLTAITTILGLLPMALGVSFDFHSFSLQMGSESSGWWKAMAWAIIFGLTFATILTLIVIPILLKLEFHWFHRKQEIAEEESVTFVDSET